MDRMDRSRADRILSEWSAIADQARRPAVAPRPATFRSSFSLATLAGGAVLALALVVGVAWLGNRGPNGQVGGPGPTPSPTPTASVAPSVTPSVVPTAKPTPKPTAVPTTASCTPHDLAARITMWEGAMGHRIAHVEMSHVGAQPCVLGTAMRPQLVDGNGNVLIDGASPSSSGSIVFSKGETVSTLVDADNYCGADPRPPVTLVFYQEDGSRIVAAPPSPNDATVPPCNSAPGSRGNIQMHEWARS